MNLLVLLIVILTVACVILFLIAKAQVKRADQAEHKAASYGAAYTEMERRAISLETIINKYKKLEVQANHERQNLADTADTDLVGRANALFRVQNGGGEPEKHTGNR
jgi:hypothetical protein